jgi:putative Mg2+ transporter-C (MgtC) family protein
MFELTAHDTDVFMRILVATGLGALIGVEREYNGKEAGFKTYTLVSLGSALMMIVSADIFMIYKGLTAVDPSRIAAQVVTGIGFLGAGAIIRDQQGVRGLTTAAGIWTVCGIGLACGIGLFKPAIFTTALVLIVLIFFQKVESHIIPKRKHEKHEKHEV